MAIIKWKSEDEVLKEKKESKKKLLNETCKSKILEGFILNFKDIDYLFSYDSEAQKNMSDRWNLFQNDMIDSIKITAHDKDGSDVRLAFNKDEFNGLYLASVHHKENCISKYRDYLLPLVEQASTLDQIESITWNSESVDQTQSLIATKDDNTLGKQLEDVKVEQAQGNIELLMLIYGMGGM